MIKDVTDNLEKGYLPGDILPPGGMGSGYFGQSFQDELNESNSGAINYSYGN